MTFEFPDLRGLQIDDATDLDSIAERLIDWHNSLKGIEERIRREREERHKLEAEAERKARLKVTFIQCPKCSQYLKVTGETRPIVVPCPGCSTSLEVKE